MLSKGKWFHLKYLSLCTIDIDKDHCEITDKGCKYLVSAKWYQIQRLEIGIFELTQVGIG